MKNRQRKKYKMASAAFFEKYLNEHKGPFNYYVTLFLADFDPPLPPVTKCHIESQPPPPPPVT